MLLDSLGRDVQSACVPLATVCRYSDLRPPTAGELVELAAHRRQCDGVYGDGFVPFRLNVVDGKVLDGPEHAGTAAGSLCGLSSDKLFTMRHRFPRAGVATCGVCASRTVE